MSESELVQDFFDFCATTEEDSFRSVFEDASVESDTKKSMVCSCMRDVGSALDEFLLTSQHPSIKQKEAKFLLKRLFRNNTLLSLFDTGSGSKISPFFSFTSMLHKLATEQFSDTIMSMARFSFADAAKFRCKWLAETLLESLCHQEGPDAPGCAADPCSLMITPALLENPGQFVMMVLLFWSIDKASQVNMLLVQYCVAILAKYCPTHSLTADSDMDQEQARQLLFVAVVQNLQFMLTIGRLRMASGKHSGNGEAESAVDDLSDDKFVRSVVGVSCVLNKSVVMLMGVTVRTLLAFACLRYRYDVVKMILEYGMVSPQPVAGGDTGRAGSPRKRMSSMSYSPGMLALSKYWGMDTLIPQLPDLALPPPPPAPPKCGAQQSGMRSAEDEDEALLQQHIMNIQMHILKQEEKMVEDEGFQYFVDVCRDDCLHFLSSKPSGTFLLRPYDSGSNSSIYLSFRGQNAPGNGPNAGEMKTSHAVIRREKTTPGSGIYSGCGYAYRCGAVGPCDSLVTLLQEISLLIPAPGLILNSGKTNATATPKMVDTGNPGNPTLLGTASRVPASDSLFEYSSVDPNSVLWSHIDVEEKSPKKSNILWFPGICLPPAGMINQRQGDVAVSEDAEGHADLTSNELSRRPLSDIAHIIQSVLHCLAIKSVHRQLVAYLNTVFSSEDSSVSSWNWEDRSAKYICQVVSELAGDDFAYYYSDDVQVAGGVGTSEDLQTRLKALSVPSDTRSAALTESVMRQHYITLFMPLLVYVNITKRHVLWELTGKTGVNDLFRDSEGQQSDSSGFGSCMSPDSTAIPVSPPPAPSRRNFLTNHVLHKFNPNLDSWTTKLNCLTELELGECVAALIFEKCVTKAVKIMHSTAPHRAHDSSLLAPGVGVHDACAWLGIHMSSYEMRNGAKDSPSGQIPSAIGLVVVSFCEKYALRRSRNKPHAAAAPAAASPIPRKKRRKSKTGSVSFSPKLGRPDVDRSSDDGVVVEVCTPMMIVNWLESMCVINIVIKPGDTFTASQKFIRYVDPWAVEPLYDHMSQTSASKSTSWGKSTIGRASYTPIVGPRVQQPLSTVTTELTSPQRFPNSRVTSPKSIDQSPNVESPNPGTGVAPSSANRSLNIAELVMSAYIHQIMDCVDIQQDEDPNIGTPWRNNVYNFNAEAEEEVLRHFRLQSEIDLDTSTAGGLQSPSGAGSSALTAESADAVDSQYTTELRTCYCYSFLSLWVGVGGEEWLLKCIDNINVFHSVQMPSTTDCSGAPVGANSVSSLSENPLLEAPISPYHMSISNNLYRNSIFHELWMSPRYVATVRVDLKSLRDISYRGKDSTSSGQWGSNMPNSAAPKDLEIFAVVRLVPASKSSSKAHIIGTGAASDLLSSAMPSRPSSTSPVPGAADGTLQHGCVIDPKQMLDSFVTPMNKVTSSQKQSSSGHTSGSLSAASTEGSSLAAEFVWDERISFRFPLPQQTYHINSLNPNHLATPEGVLHKDNYLNNLYEAPAILCISIFQKSFSFTSALSGIHSTSSNNFSKLGEVEIPFDSISDRLSNPAVSDWYPLSQSSNVTVGGSPHAASKTANSGIWLLYLELQLNYVLMAGSE